jgi:hypothetical protein
MSDELYSWRGESLDDSDSARIVGEHLMALSAKLGRELGAITADDVVEDARNPSSPLHKYFQWDDKIAADNWRRAQARILLSSIRYRVSEGEPKKIGFINVRVDSVGRSYVPMNLAEHHAGLVRQAREGALHGLRAWQTRYGQLSGTIAYELIGQAADALAAELEAPPALPDSEAA